MLMFKPKMNTDQLSLLANIIEEAKKEQRRKKLELNRVKVLEEKQIEKVNAPIVKKLEENESKLEKAINPDLDMQDEFDTISDKNGTVKYRFNKNKMLDDMYRYISSNSNKNLIKILNITDGSEPITIELPNSRVFKLFFKNTCQENK